MSYKESQRQARIAQLPREIPADKMTTRDILFETSATRYNRKYRRQRNINRLYTKKGFRNGYKIDD